MKKHEVKMWGVVINKPEKGMGPLVCGGSMNDNDIFVTYIMEDKKELIKLIKACYAPEPSLTRNMIKGIKRVTVSW